MRDNSTGRNFLIASLFAFTLLHGCNSSNSDSTTETTNNTPSSQKLQSESVTDENLPPLISADELAKLIESKTKDLKILEPSADLKEFSQGHLPTAQVLHWVDDMTDPADTAKYNLPDKQRFSQVMSQLGIKNSDRIVIYDRLSSRLSTRLFWSLKIYGHDRVQVLDGGFTAGKAKLDLSKSTVKATASQYNIVNSRDSMNANLKMVQEKLEDPNLRLIDGRPKEQFTGEKPGMIFHTGHAHSRKGHIPGAKNIFWKDNFNPDGTFKSPKELRSLYRKASILPENEVITYCNEGLHAAPPWFVLTQLLGYDNVRLYDSSMAEWAESEQPMQTLSTDK